MSEMNSNVSWSSDKNGSDKGISQAPQQIFLLTVAYPQVSESDSQVIKSIGSFNENITGQQHILLQPVNSVLPIASVSETKNAVNNIELEEKDGRYSPLVVLNAPVRQESCSNTTVVSDSTNYTLPQNLVQSATLSLTSNAKTQISQFQLAESTPVISFEEAPLPDFSCSSKGILDNGLDVVNSTVEERNQTDKPNNITENDIDVDGSSKSEVEEVRQVISDGPIIPRAKLTLPSDYLVFKNIYSRKDMLGVFAKKEIPERAQFGPVKGVLSTTNRMDPPCPGLRLILHKQDGTKHTISNRNEELSNWMRYVRVAFKAPEQNLALHQVNEELYFTTTRAIKAGQELRVWYSNKYAARRNLPLLTSGKEKWICSKCPFVSLKSKPMNQHLIQHRCEMKQNSKAVESNITGLQTSGKHDGQINSNECTSTNSFSKRNTGCRMCDTEFCPIHSNLTTFIHGDNVSDNEVSHESDSLEEDEMDDLLKKGVVCNICGRIFISSKALDLHYKTHNDNLEFDCPLCNQKFDKVLDMKNHIATHKENGKFRCSSCDKEFPTYKQVRKHIRMGHTKRIHNCTHCLKTFATPDRLKIHLLSHSSDKQFLCTNCGRQFKRKDKLVAHMRSIHNKAVQAAKGRPPKGPPVNPGYIFLRYKCLECHIGFKKRGVLVNHMLSRHPGTNLNSVPDLKQPILKQSKDFLCKYCDKVYKSSTKRKAHILKYHPGAKLPSTNSQEPAEATYTQTVGSISAEPQSCEWCSKQYASKAKLIQHQRKAHLDLMPKELRLPSAPSSKLLSQRSKKVDSTADNSQEEPNKTYEIKTSSQYQPSQTNVSGMEVGVNEGIFLSDGGIIVDGPTLKKVLKIGDSNIECTLDSGFEQLLAESRPDQYFKILTQGGITIAQPVELWDPMNLAPTQPTNQSTPSDQGTSQLTSDIIIPH